MSQRLDEIKQDIMASNPIGGASTVVKDYLMEVSSNALEIVESKPDLGKSTIVTLVRGVLSTLPSVPHPTDPTMSVVVMDDRMAYSLVYSAILLGVGLSIEEEIR
jgi:hypothetical protein